MIPNYYDMPKANPEIITDDSLYNGIVMAYHHGNIGTPSNEITKIFDTLNPNSTKEEIQQAIEIVALRCCDVNYVIDYAKTLYKPTIPRDVKAIYKQYSGRKVPKFFIYAKDKQNNQVEEITDNNINRISKIVRSNKIVFNDKNVLGQSKYNYKMLMTNPDVEFTGEQGENILSLYRELELCKLRQLKRMDFDTCDVRDKQKVLMFLEKDALVQREQFSEMLGYSKEFICDVLIKILQGDANKDTLWKLFGDIIYKNLEGQLSGTKRCKVCGDRFIANNNKAKYCNECALKIKNEQNKSYYRKK